MPYITYKVTRGDSVNAIFSFSERSYQVYILENFKYNMEQSLHSDKGH